MTLREQMESDIADVFLNTDEHAETVTYTPKGGAARTVSVIIDEDAEFAGGSESSRVDIASVFVRRDGATGIDNPQLGDVLSLNRNGFAIAYAWTGEYGEADEFGWWLVWRRTRMERIGSNVAVR